MNLTRRRLLMLSAAHPLVRAALGEAQLNPIKGTDDQACTPAYTCTHVHNDFAWQKPPSVREFLELITFRKSELDGFLDPQRPNFILLNPGLGYTIHTNIVKDGVDGANTVQTYSKAGQRRMVNLADQPCRINTYGNSFTQCGQVSDGETWQEYLGSHLGEPLRNFGIGGWGVYQAYRCMLQNEATPSAAEHLILNIYGIDDNFRSLDQWKWIRFGGWWRKRPGSIWFATWPYARLNINTGALVEADNPFPTPESLYQLADPQFVYRHFKDDLIVQLLVAQWMGAGVDIDLLKSVAEFLHVEPQFSTPAETAQTAAKLHLEYALRTTQRIIGKFQAFAQEHHKKLLVLLSYDSDLVVDACNGQPRLDQKLVDYLQESNIRHVDGLARHLDDFHQFRISPREYIHRYYNGHYKPQGNHFFAFAIKDTVVDMLEPKPPAYRPGMETVHS